MHGRRLLGLSLAAVLVAGCGSTAAVPTGTGAAALSHEMSLGGTSAGETGTAAAGGSGPVSDAVAVGQVDGTTVLPQAASGPGVTASGGVHSSAAANGPVVTQSTVGVTDRAIKIGVRYVTGAKQFVAAFGSRGLNVSDTKATEQAFVTYLNKHGGIAGREVTPVWQPYNVVQIAEARQQEQQNCAAWAEDSHVFAAVSPIPSGSDLPACMAAHRTPLIQDSVGLYFDDVVMKQTAGYFYTPDEPNGTRAGRLWVDGLAKQHYFGSQPHIGLVLLDDPSYHRIADDAIRPEIQRLGYQVDKEVTIGATADVASGVLQFKAAGITHVLILDDSSLVAQLWMNQAESQDYRPKYGLNSVNAPFVLQKNVPPAQLIGSTGVGWFPDYDVDYSQDPPANAATAACGRAMRSAGVSMSSSRVMEGIAMNTCDVFWFLKRAIESATQFTPAAVFSAISGFGSSYLPAGSFRTHFVPGRPDGMSAARDFAFSSACTCFHYTSPVYSVG